MWLLRRGRERSQLFATFDTIYGKIMPCKEKWVSPSYPSFFLAESDSVFLQPVPVEESPPRLSITAKFPSWAPLYYEEPI